METFGILLSTSTINRFFKKHFQFRGSLQNALLVPIHTWKPQNLRDMEIFKGTLNNLPEHRKYHFIDKNYIINDELSNERILADSFTGRVRFIFGNGTFREAYNLVGIIRCKPAADPAMHFSIGQENGTGNAASLTAYIEHLLSINWFERGDVLIMDNAAIHTRAEDEFVADLLWLEREVLVVPLPTRAPELNPIEFIFHILARRLRFYRYRSGGNDPAEMTVPEQVRRIISDTITSWLVLKCAAQCGY
jgi:transposase